MISWSLRARVLTGLGMVALLLATASLAVNRTMHTRLVAQVDDQLEAIARDGGGIPATLRERPRRGGNRERFSVVFEGLLLTDGTLITVFEPNTPGRSFSPPVLDADTPITGWSPFSVPSAKNDLRYRVLATNSPFPDVAYTIHALPLDDVDEALARLQRFQVLTFAVVLAALGAVAWWVIHLGIRPVQAMTDAAGRIADGDLDHRVPEPKAATTESGRLARALNTMLSRIQREVDARSRSEERLRTFVADASHELRTPLTTIRGYTDLYLQGGLRTGAELDDAMRRSQQEAARMSRLVDDMLTLAKLDRERIEVVQPVDVARVLTDVADNLRITAPNHTLTVSAAPDLHAAAADDRLRQVVSNLVRNAIVHTPPGTLVTVRAWSDDDRVLIEVRDDGPGMSSDDVSRVTERFYRTDTSRSRASGGSGLGLAIVDAIVGSFSGELRLESTPGEGTAAVVSLPLYRIGRTEE